MTVLLRPGGTEKKPTMEIVANVHQQYRDVGAVKPLASASVTMPTTGYGDLCAACLSALYELDKEMYLRQIGVNNIGR